MDHLPLPKYNISAYPRVPFICEDTPDVEDFFSLQQSFIAKWKLNASSEVFSLTLWLTQAARVCSVAEIESFLQRWIFFGLLRELLSPVGLFNRSDYIDNEANLIHTRHLAQTVEQWNVVVTGYDPVRRSSLRDRLYQCLEAARRAIFQLYHRESDVKLALDHTVKISILVIFDTISALGKTCLDSSSSEKEWRHSTLSPVLTQSMRTLLLENGWCPSEIESVQRKYQSTLTRLYIYHMRKLSDVVDHSECTEDACEKMQVEPLRALMKADGLQKNGKDRSRSIEEDSGQATQTQVEPPICGNGPMDQMINTSYDECGSESETETTQGAYRPPHALKGCICSLHGPDRAAVADCLDRDTYPLLKICETDQGEVSIEVVPFSHADNTVYVALSHVWADGLGNPDETKLPLCQARRLRDLVESLSGKTLRWGSSGEERKIESDLLLWCDTYCCPTKAEDSQRRNLALDRMQHVYENAAYVLVLDSEIERVPSIDIDIIEQVARLVTARWTKRLWTFQEGALAKKLLIKFADQVVDFRELAHAIGARSKQNPLHHHVAELLHVACIEMKAWFSMVKANRRNQLRLVASALAERAVTVKSDEPICLSVALELDVKQVVKKTTAEERMEVFWRLLSSSPAGIPYQIIHNTWPRLSKEGMRWAPASLLSEPRDIYGMIPGENTLNGTSTPHGLRVTAPGLHIQARSPLIGLEDLAVGPQLTLETDLRDPDGCWYHVGFTCNVARKDEELAGHHSQDCKGEISVWHHLQDRGKDWFVIIDHDWETRGLLAFADRQAEPCVYRSVAVIQIYRVNPERQGYLNVARKHADILRVCNLGRLLALKPLRKRVFQAMAAWTPRMFRGVLFSWLTSWTDFALLKPIERRFVKRIGLQAAEAAKEPEAAAYVRATFNEESPPPWQARLTLDLLGLNGLVVQTFDSSHEWIVD